MKLELCQCENRYDFRTGVVVCAECGKTKLGVPLPTTEQMQAYKDYLNSLKGTPTP
jgi:hypothetical protein